MIPDMYRDTEARYRHDVNFRATVDLLTQMAVTEGYTPGELRQAAFLAALHAEQHAPRVNEALKNIINAANEFTEPIHYKVRDAINAAREVLPE